MVKWLKADSTHVDGLVVKMPGYHFLSQPCSVKKTESFLHILALWLVWSQNMTGASFAPLSNLLYDHKAELHIKESEKLLFMRVLGV